jgi:hypothetical protein
MLRIKGLIIVIGFLGCVTAFAADEPTKKRTIAIEASPTILAKGTLCSVDLFPEEKTRGQSDQPSYIGTIVETSETGMLLLVKAESHRVVHNATYGTRLPYVGRMFRNIGIGKTDLKEEKKLWLPIDKIQIVRPLPADALDQQPPPASSSDRPPGLEASKSGRPS